MVNKKIKYSRTTFIIEDMVRRWKAEANVMSSEYIAETYNVSRHTARRYLRMFRYAMKEQLKEYDLPTLVVNDIMNLRDVIQNMLSESKTLSEKEKAVHLQLKYLKEMRSLCDSWDLSFLKSDEGELAVLRKDLKELEKEDIDQGELSDNAQMELNDDIQISQSDDVESKQDDNDSIQEELDDDIQTSQGNDIQMEN